MILNNAYSFKSPESIKVYSGCAGTTDDGDYAFLTISAKNGYGVAGMDYYSFNEEYGVNEAIYSFNDTDFDFSYLCKREMLNTFKINLRLKIHWATGI